MLEQEVDIKIRKDNLYVRVDKYKLTTLEVDLFNSVVSICVDFYRDGIFIIRKKYEFSDKGDVNVNKLISECHSRIINGE